MVQIFEDMPLVARDSLVDIFQMVYKMKLCWKADSDNKEKEAVNVEDIQELIAFVPNIVECECLSLMKTEYRRFNKFICYRITV
eukprot:UN17739